MLTAILWIFGCVAGITAIILALDQLMLWMERRGWMYWRRSKRVGGSGVSNALLEIQSLIESDKRHTVEIIREEKKDQTNSGAPPTPSDRKEDEICE